MSDADQKYVALLADRSEQGLRRRWVFFDDLQMFEGSEDVEQINRGNIEIYELGRRMRPNRGVTWEGDSDAG